MTYASFQNQVSSEKLTLAVLHASKRLMAWTLHSGSIYKIENFNIASIVSLEDSGTAYSEVTSIAACTASKFYNDRDNQVLYLRASDSSNPNSRFLVLTFKLFFASAPIVLPQDLSTGTEVFWEPTIKSTSAFGVEIDTINQTSEAIEGSGSLTLVNDQSFWSENFDKNTFENKPCFIYSFNRDLDVTQAKLIFSGKVESKTFSPTEIKFSLKDQLSELKASVNLSNIEDLSERTSDDLAKAKQRMIFGRVFGHRLVNLDQVLDGYPVTGTVSITTGSPTLTGSGTSFKTELSPDDVLILGGSEYSIASIASATSATLSTNFAGTTNLSGVTTKVKPALPKRYMNRRWLVAGHAIKEPSTTINTGSTITRLIVDSTENIFDGDYIYIGTLGSGELTKVDQVVSSTLITLSASLTSIPTPGTTLFKPAVQNVRIDDLLLTYYSDYTFDASTGILVLSDDAEKNAAPIMQLTTNLVFNSTTTVTGTSLRSQLKPGYMISAVGHGDYYEIQSIESDTSLTLRSAAGFTDASNKGLFKSFILDPDNSVLTCDVLGRTDDGTTTGQLLKTAPSIVRQLLVDIGLTSSLDETSFSEAEDLAKQEIGLVIPAEFSETEPPIYRDVINDINKSIFGSLIQRDNFSLGYLVLQPNKTSGALRLNESDVLSFSVSNQADQIIKTAIVEYRPKEYDYISKKPAVSSQQKTSDVATYILKIDKTRTFSTKLVNSDDAERNANRWAFLLENSSALIKIKTKLQGASLDVGSIVEISHQKLYQRMGSAYSRKIGLVESVKKSGTSVEIAIVDLSNAFNRIGSITDLTTTWANTNEDGRLYGGFITDQYGLIDDEESSFNSNLIW